MSEYDDIWEEIREKVNVTAKDYVPKLYESLIKDGYSPKEARDKIKKDAFNIWKVETIDKLVPQEAKQKIKVAAGQQRGKTKTEIEKSEDINKDSAGLESSTQEDTNPEPEEEQPELAPYTSTDDIIKVQQELELTQQLLKEERSKSSQLNERIDQKDGELEDHAYKIQELTRRLTAATTEVIDIADNAGEVDKPTFEQHWNQLVDAECSFCHKITPLIIRHFISGKVVKWIDRDRYKELYGMVPAEI